MFFSLFLSGQRTNVNIPTGCVKEVCVPASYKSIDDVTNAPAVSYIVPGMRRETKVIPRVTAQKPITRTVTKQICVKEGGIEYEFKCDENDPKVRELCRIIIAPEFKEVSYEEPTGEFEEVVVQEEQTVTYLVPSGQNELVVINDGGSITTETLIKTSDGFITNVACNQTAAISLSTSSTPETCSSLSSRDGTVMVSFAKSKGLSALWSNGSSDVEQKGLSTGTYTVTVTDLNGNTNVGVAKVTDLNRCN